VSALRAPLTLDIHVSDLTTTYHYCVQQVPLADLYSGASRTIRIWTQKADPAGGAPVREPKDVDIVIEPGMRSGATVVLRGEQVSSSSCCSVVLLLLDIVFDDIIALCTVVVYV
jgi:hypothetical protein